MADELGILLSAELDTSKAESQLSKLKGEAKKGKVQVGVDSAALKRNIKEALNSIAASYKVPPIKIAVGVNVGESKKLLNDYLKSIKNTTINLPIAPSASRNAKGSSGRSGNKSGSGLSGVPYNQITGGGKNKAVFEEQYNKYKKQFEDRNKNYKLTSADLKYNPVSKQYTALIKYNDTVGKTTSMLMRMDEETQKFNVVQTGFSENFAKQANEIEKTKEKLQDYKTVYKDLYSKAFNQKNPLSGQFGDTAKSALNSLNKEIQSVTGTMTKAQEMRLKTLANDAARVIREQQSAQYSATTLNVKDVTKQIGTEQSSLNAYIAQLKQAGVYTGEIQTKFDGLKNTLNSVGDSAGLTSYLDDLRQAKASVDEVKASISGQGQMQAKLIDDNQLAKLAEYQNLLSQGDLGQMNTSGIEAFRQKIDGLITNYQLLQDELRSDSLTPDQFNQASAKVEMLNKELTNVSTTMKNLGNQDWVAKNNTRIEKLKSDFEGLKKTYAEALANPELASEAAKIESHLLSVDALNFSNVQAEVSSLGSKLKVASSTASTFGAEIKNAVQQMLGLYSVASVIGKMVSGLKTVVGHVKEINSAMIELRKVTDLNESDYDKFLKSAGSKSKQIGTTMTNLINSTASFSRLGFEFTDAKTLAESANIYLQVGDEIANINEASQSLISTMQAYGYSANEALTIVDKLNAAGNNMAISSGGLGTALQDSASALAAANNTLDESIALISAANKVAQDPTSVGNAWKTVSMRIRSAETELEAAGEDTDGMVKSTAELQEMIKSTTGFDILEADGKTFKSTYEIIKGIAKEWNNLSDIDQAGLLEAIAGKRQANIVSATLNNMADLEKSMDVTQNATGSAMAEHERWMQSIEASENKAKTAVEEFSNAFMSSSLVKFSYDAQAGILGFLTQVTEKLGALPLASTALMGALSFKNKGSSNMNMPCSICYDAAA